MIDEFVRFDEQRFHVRGWMVSGERLSHVGVMQNGEVVGEGSFRDPRMDVKEVYTSSAVEAPGFALTWTVNAVQADYPIHQIGLLAVDEKGEVVAAFEREFFVVSV